MAYCFLAVHGTQILASMHLFPEVQLDPFQNSLYIFMTSFIK